MEEEEEEEDGEDEKSIPPYRCQVMVSSLRVYTVTGSGKCLGLRSWSVAPFCAKQSTDHTYHTHTCHTDSNNVNNDDDSYITGIAK